MLRSQILFGTIVFLFFSCSEEKKTEEWINLFNGKGITSWKSNENDSSFQVVDGVLVASGPRSHLFYLGDDGQASFKNFELQAEIQTTSLANSGVYFHTQWQDDGWPKYGLEAQVNVSHKGAGDYREVKKGGSLYGLRNVYKAFAKDSVWYQMNLKVEDRRVRIWMDNVLLVDYVVPLSEKKLNSGTFALQCHDPESQVLFRSIRVKMLPDNLKTANTPEVDANSEILKHQANHIAFIDFGIEADDSVSIKNYLDVFFKTGINLGVLSTNRLGNEPVFKGMEVFVEDEPLSQDDRKNIDYSIGEFSKVKGQKMEKYIAQLKEYLASDRLNIWLNAEDLPKEKWLEILQVAKDNNVAIGINSKEKWPSLEFIITAKESGCKMATTSLIDQNGEVSIGYFLEVIEKAKLDYKDIYIPDKNISN